MDWHPPADWLRIQTLDLHTAGEPLRIITSGYPALRGGSILERRRDALENHDSLRRALMYEPRGHADMYGCVLTPAATPDGDLGVIFMHNEGYSTMCGHAILGLVKVGVEVGLLEYRPDHPVYRIDTPAGRITATAHLEPGAGAGMGLAPRVGRASFLNVPSFVLERDLLVEVPGMGEVRTDIAFGGAFYAYVDAEPLGLELEPWATQELIEAGMRIKRAVMESYGIAHPEGDEDLNFLYGTIFTRMHPPGAKTHSRNVCIFAEGEVDRSPTGTGVSGRAALHHARGELAPGASLCIESILGTTMTVRAVRDARVGDLDAIIPEVSGTAYLTGRHEFLVDPRDPLGQGFLLR